MPSWRRSRPRRPQAGRSLMRALGLAGVAGARAPAPRSVIAYARPRPISSTAISRSPGRIASGRGHHVHPDVGRLPLPRRRARCVEPPRRRLGRWRHILRRARVSRRFKHGPAQRRPNGGDPSLRPGLPVPRRFAFGQRCRDMDVRPSMGSVGDAYDNALCESFFATLECELLDRHRFQTQAEARMANLRIHRGVVQPAPPPLCPRLPVPHQLREEPVPLN